MDPGRHVGRAVRVFWVDDDEWYGGVVNDYQPQKGWHIQYYDGEEEWLTSLDENVSFDDPDDLADENSDVAGLGNTSATDLSETGFIIIPDDVCDPKPHSQTLSNSSSQNIGGISDADTEFSRKMGDTSGLESVQFSSTRSIDAEKNSFLLSADATVDRRDMNSSSKLNVVGTCDHESYRRRDYRAESQHLPGDNPPASSMPYDGQQKQNIASQIVPPGGLILLGSVAGATNLPVTDDKETGGKCIFRVLYIEGTGANTMFRCKTPIFTSIAADDLQSPRWDDDTGSFDFEMALPPSKGDSEIQIQGQIVVAVYRLRSQGGNEFVGQVCFEMSDLAQNGTKVAHKVGVEARSLHGEYPLIDRFDKSVGNYAEIEVNLQVAWLPPVIVPDVGSRSQTNLKRPTTATSANGRSSGTQRQGQGTVNTPRQMSSGASVAGTVRTNTTKGALTPRTRPSSASVIPKGFSRGPAPVKLVSAQLRKQAEDKKRIDAQNKLMQGRLQSKGTKDRGDVTGSIYKVEKAEGKVPSSSAHSVRTSTRGKSEKDSGPNLDEVVGTWTKLKKEVSEIEDENQLLKATLSKLRLQSKRHTLATDKLRKQSKPSTVNDVKNDISVSRNESLTKEQKSISIERLHEVIEDGQFADVDDCELREVAIENFNLQQIRRSLLDRARVASTTCGDHAANAASAQDAEVLLRHRIAVAAPHIIPHVDVSDVTENQKDLLSLMDKLRSVKLDFMCAETAKEHGFHFGPLEDAIMEDRELLKMLRKRLDDMQREANTCQHDCEASKDKLTKLMEDRSVYKIRDSIANLRLILFNFRTKKCPVTVENDSDNSDHEY